MIGYVKGRDASMPDADRSCRRCRRVHAGRPTLSGAVLAALVAGGCAAEGRAPEAAPQGGFSLRARGADARVLLAFLSLFEERSVVVGAEVQGTLDLDLRRGSVLEMEQEAARAAGAGWLVMGQAVLIGGPHRLAAAERHPLRPDLAESAYHGRKVRLTFSDAPVGGLLCMLADASKRRCEVAEGVDERVTISTRSGPWTEVVDLVAVASDLTREDTGATLRISRRGDASPRFSSLGTRDFFEPFVGHQRRAMYGSPREVLAEREGRCAGKMGQEDVGALTLVAVAIGPALSGALARSPAGDFYALFPGECVGPTGLVAGVGPEGVAVVRRQASADRETAGVERFLRFGAE